MTKLKVLSITQPYADLIMNGLKTVEDRPKKTKYRGPIGIHARSTDHSRAIATGAGIHGAIIGTCLLIASIDMCEITDEDMEDLHKYGVKLDDVMMDQFCGGSIAWVFFEPRRASEPIYTKGISGNLWNFDLEGHEELAF